MVIRSFFSLSFCFFFRLDQSFIPLCHPKGLEREESILIEGESGKRMFHLWVLDCMLLVDYGKLICLPDIRHATRTLRLLNAATHATPPSPSSHPDTTSSWKTNEPVSECECECVW